MENVCGDRMAGRCGCCECISNKKWVVVSSIFENSGDSGRSRSLALGVGMENVHVGMGWQVNAGAVSAYQTKNGSLSPRFLKTPVIQVGLARVPHRLEAVLQCLWHCARLETAGPASTRAHAGKC